MTHSKLDEQNTLEEQIAIEVGVVHMLAQRGEDGTVKAVQALLEAFEQTNMELLNTIDEQLHGILADVQGYDGWSEEFVKGYLAAVRDNHLNIKDQLSAYRNEAIKVIRGEDND